MGLDGKLSSRDIRARKAIGSEKYSAGFSEDQKQTTSKGSELYRALKSASMETQVPRGRA